MINSVRHNTFHSRLQAKGKRTRTDRSLTSSIVLSIALGAGTELTSNYKSLKLVFLDIENIHEIRASLIKLHKSYLDAVANDTIVTTHQVDKSGWQSHLKTILAGTALIVKTVHQDCKHVILHCSYHSIRYSNNRSDGWDRTAQLCALAQLCLFSQYRTLAGFLQLIRKEFLSFGHKFADRSGVSLNPTDVSSERFSFKSPIKEVAPVFLQFLECVFVLIQERREGFGFSETLLEVLYESIYDGRIRTFRSNCEREAGEKDLSDGIEIWELIDGRFEVGQGIIDVDFIVPSGKVGYWWGMYGNTRARGVSGTESRPVTDAILKSLGELRIRGEVARDISMRDMRASFDPLGVLE